MRLVQAPNQLLRVKTKPVKKITPAHRQIIQRMIKLTRTFVDPEGVGLASTQIGKDEQYFVAKLKSGKFKAFFNPRILSYSKKKRLVVEGCLSIPNYWGKIQRPAAVTVSYLDEKGQAVKERLTGQNAHIFQHEYDHLQGKLFMDIVLEQKAQLFKVTKDKYGTEVFQEVSL